MTREEKEQTGKYLLKMARLLEDECWQQKMLLNAVHIIDEVLEQEPRWIPVSERLPNKNQWVLVTTEDYQKLVEIMCYQGIRIGRRDVGNGWEEYEYPSWTSGHGDIQSSHPKAWMPLPKVYKAESEDEE